MKKFLRGKRHHVRSQAEAMDSCTVSRASHGDYLEEMFHKLAESNIIEEGHNAYASVDPLRLKLMMSLSIAEESAKSDEVLMKVKRLRSKILSNFVRIDEPSDASFVSWNSHAMPSFDDEIGCEVVDHSTPHQSISAIRINELPPESPKYNPTEERFEIVSSGFISSLDEYLDTVESGYEVSTDLPLSKDIIIGKAVHSSFVCDDSKSGTCALTSDSDSDFSGIGSDCFDRCDCGMIETTADDSFIGIEVSIKQ